MNFTTYANNLNELGKIHQANLDEVILSNKELSRFATNNLEELLELAKEAKDLGLKVILEWDVLITEDDFESSINEFKKVPENLYDSIRVQDAGVFQYILEEGQKPIQLILETGNHNLVGVQKWIEHAGDRLERVILSLELNKEKLAEYIKNIHCPVEFMGLGRILLFYSPRKLLSALLPEDDELKTKSMVSEDYLAAVGESEESPHKGFPIVENKHGTFMFHIKDLFLLDKISELEEMNLSYVRLDLRFKDQMQYLEEIISLYKEKSDYQEFKKNFNSDVIRGYYQINKSDVLFKKLKNYRIQRKDDSYIGEVIEATKGEYLAVQIRSEAKLSLGDQVRFINPEGKEFSCKVHTLQDVALNEVNSLGKNQVALMNYMTGVWPKSQVYLGSLEE